MSDVVRDRWSKGIVRHLKIDDRTPLDAVYAMRLDHDGGMFVPGGSTDIFYTLVVHPKHADRVEEYRQMLERNPELGGVFSPSRDIQDRTPDCTSDDRPPSGIG
jgi:hypothetical protein